ncbi:Acg family FMN-binding oxidoreductase [Nocardia blacklockiae]|uniref:Acg family FMN-binding oxidoreductase n=1 Tax=Nocardia blacklockiae TaxID=480036 RepID=UPI001894BFEE|nr:nitroreductase family protein [Nocardia blacklockiae]MBF6170659.1 nitroreductase family protein [Nocardia blacklockiae]
MGRQHPDRDTVRAALALAVRAPSVHNTQPWRWEVGRDTVQLFADAARRLPHTDPDGRDMILSCGAALHHLRVAAHAFGWRTVVRRLPDPRDPDHLAAVEFHAATPAAAAMRLARAIPRRRTDRRQYTCWPVPAEYVSAVVAAGAAHGVPVRDIGEGPARVRLLCAFEQAAWAHARDFSYGAELAQWSGRHGSAEGVAAGSAVLATEPTVRPFSNPGLPAAVVRDPRAADRMLLLSTAADDRLAQLTAGEAAGAVLLTATVFGLATCPLTEPLEVAGTRSAIRAELLGGSAFPQLIVRIGWAAPGSGPVPATARRPLDQVVV